MRKVLRLLTLIISSYWLYYLLKGNFSLILPIVLMIVFIGLTRVLNIKGTKEKIEIANIDQMDGLEFEEFTTNLYSAMGWQSYKTKASGDFGADVIAKKKDITNAIQCKRYSGAVGVEAVQQIVAAMPIYRANVGTVITNSTFTNAAKTLAKANNIELIDRDKLYSLYRKIKAV